MKKIRERVNEMNEGVKMRCLWHEGIDRDIKEQSIFEMLDELAERCDKQSLKFYESVGKVFNVD